METAIQLAARAARVSNQDGIDDDTAVLLCQLAKRVRDLADCCRAMEILRNAAEDRNYKLIPENMPRFVRAQNIARQCRWMWSDRDEDSVPYEVQDAEAVSMLQELASEHPDRVIALCPNGTSRWDVVDVLQQPYKDGVPEDEWLLGSGPEAKTAVFDAGRVC